MVAVVVVVVAATAGGLESNGWRKGRYTRAMMARVEEQEERVNVVGGWMDGRCERDNDNNDEDDILSDRWLFSQ